MHMRAHLHTCANGGKSKMLLCLLCWSYMRVQQNRALYFYVGARDWNSEQAVYMSRVLMVCVCTCVCAHVCACVHVCVCV